MNKLTDLRFAHPAFGSALFVSAGVFLLPFVTLGPLSTQMLTHIVVMSVLAPLLSVLGALLSPHRASVGVWPATTLQISLLMGWHLPAAHHLAMHSVVGAVAMHASLLLVAFLFWDALIRLPERTQWQGILALLITGKLVCVLAGLLVFATRPLFHPNGGAGALADQQLAGLLMIAACPASYVLAGVIVAVRFVGVLQPTPQVRAD